MKTSESTKCHKYYRCSAMIDCSPYIPTQLFTFLAPTSILHAKNPEKSNNFISSYHQTLSENILSFTICSLYKKFLSSFQVLLSRFLKRCLYSLTILSIESSKVQNMFRWTLTKIHSACTKSIHILSFHPWNFLSIYLSWNGQLEKVCILHRPFWIYPW